MDLDFCKEFIQPELLALVPALNFLGTVLKRSASVPDKNIPLLLGGAGVLLSAVWVVGQNTPWDLSQVLAAVFTALVQGLLCAAGSVYLHQLMKQRKKPS